MKLWNWCLGILASGCAVVILLITSFELAMYTDDGIYRHEYEKYNVLSELDMQMEDVMYVTGEMMAYLRGQREELSVITTVEGREQDFFNEQDRLHMADVQALFFGGLRLRIGAIFLLAVSLLLLVVQKADLKRILSRSYQGCLLVLGVFLLALGIGVGRDFNGIFIRFHEIFFSNDLWIFDPAQDYMIRMMPEGLFFDMVLLIGGIFLAFLAVLFVFSIFFGKRGKKEKLTLP